MFDVKTWGWITLLWGIAIGLAGMALLAGAGWARWLTIILASVNILEMLGFEGASSAPLWALTVLALNIVVALRADRRNGTMLRWAQPDSPLRERPRSPAACPGPGSFRRNPLRLAAMAYHECRWASTSSPRHT